MNQPEFLQYLTQSIDNNIEIPIEEINTPMFRKIQPFHKEMLWKKSFECCSIYYENIYSQFYNNPDLNNIFYLLLDRPKTPLLFFEHIFTKYPQFIISSKQEKIINFPIDFFPVLFSKTVMTSSKISTCLFNLFKNPSENIEKINFIIENQKKKYIPFHEDMYYLIFFFAYMEKNSLKKRTYFCREDKIIKIRPFKITDKFIETAEIIYKNFNNVFDFIKPNMVRTAYKSQNYSNEIINEEDFIYFIEVVSSLLHKNKIEEKLSAYKNSSSKTKVKKI